MINMIIPNSYTFKIIKSNYMKNLEIFSEYADYFKHYSLIRDRKLDSLDFKILLLIYCGVVHCSHIATHTDTTLQIISRRVRKLEKSELVLIESQQRRSYSRRYSLTEVSKTVIQSTLPSLQDFNLFLIMTKYTRFDR